MLPAGLPPVIEERAAPILAATAVAGVVLHVVGYLSLRFRLRALGINPELGLVNEGYLFEGAALVIYLLSQTPLLLAIGLVGGLALAVARRIPPLRSRIDAAIERARNASPATIAAFGAIWAVVTVQFFLRQVLHYRDLVHDGVPCHPSWLVPVALSSDFVEGAFFTLLLFLPVPTIWAVRSLAAHAGWRPATVLLGLVALLQVLLIPVHHGILVSHATVPRVALADSDPDVTNWEIFRSETHFFVLTREDGSPPIRRLRTFPAKDWGTVEIESMDSLYGILMEGRVCN